MKLTNNRIYLDYNATSPLANSVKEYLAKGDFQFGNPSSIHASGKSARREINRSIEKIKNIYSISDEYDLLFHSGATEGANILIQGMISANKVKDSFCFAYGATDHSCSYNLAEVLEKLGHKTYKMEVNRNGLVNWEKVKSDLSQYKSIILNFTWVNNETGVKWDLKNAIDLKNSLNCIIHVDAVQSIGKIEDWTELEKSIDCYTFSSHKFGGLKGHGFSFVKPDLKIDPIIIGGGHQKSIRPGTENPMGAKCAALALEEVNKNFNYKDILNFKNKFEESLKLSIKGKGDIFAVESDSRCASTLYFYIDGTKADTLLMALDMAGIDVSTGSACSSGAVGPSRVLLEMGHSEEIAKSGIRISFSPQVKEEFFQEIWDKFEKVISRFV